MNKWVKAKWLRALKGGEYAKGKGRLGVEGVEYCCLGVLVCEMAPEFVYESNGQIGVGKGPRKRSYIPDDLAIMWGLSLDVQESLSRTNDYSGSFDPVIQYIETNL